MENIIKGINRTVLHIKALHKTFMDERNFAPLIRIDYEKYQSCLEQLESELGNLDYETLLYQKDARQMILADIFEYIFLGRIYYSLGDKSDRSHFIKSILLFANLLMYFEVLTFSDELRLAFLENLSDLIPEVADEDEFDDLSEFRGRIGISGGDDSEYYLSRYFDTLLPKTAGGLWHELLAYVHILRNDVGYIIPLLLNQKLVGLSDHLVPPDFLIIEKDKKSIFGIEIGTFKERQSNNFMLKTGIPTISLDTRNARTDRCPICDRWISFCPYVIKTYSDLDNDIDRAEIKCLQDCDIFTEREIAEGNCSYTKYSRNRIQAEHSHHAYADGLHYHYQCVLDNVSENQKELIIDERDVTALKTHYPYYSGLEGIG